MFFIYGTDAPIYHYPIVTTVMIVINVFIHLIVSSTGYDFTPWILMFADGLHPLQWVTHNFLHAGWIQLIANMIFLFPFGLIVEGKIGWLRMLVLYMAIATGQGMTQQVIMLPSDPVGDVEAFVESFDDPAKPMNEEEKRELKKQWREDLLRDGFGSVSTSAVIFGLLAICAIWAPVNDFNVYFRWSLLVSASDGGEREWSVLTVCGIFVAQELAVFLMMGMPFSSQALHLNGFFVGGAFGLATLYFGSVDCEGFDLISHWGGTKFKAKRIRERDRRERLAALEAAKPKGPPVAIVPKMAHELQPRDTAANPLSTPIMPRPTVPRTNKIPSVPLQPTNFVDSDALFDLSLPEFDDGVAAVDPKVEARNKIEAMVLRGDFPAAVRLLAEIRKQDREFVVSAASMGRLAEGLIKSNHHKQAITLLTVGCHAYPAHEPQWRIRLGSLELFLNQDPIAAIKQLRMIDKEMLDTRLRNQYLKIAQHAKQMASR